ncbi:MAG: hypothetical protein IJI53_12355 [Clostridia bacterium]|nr:hypothetical protein [Clostridia bacterium]MBR0408823.1 hypothetical protein [Clostridia bacterium]
MDAFLEEVVTKQNRTIQTVSYIMANVLMVLFGAMALLDFATIGAVFAQTGFNLDFILVLVRMLVFAAAAVGMFLYRDRVKVEYEYTFTNGQMDFAQVFNNKKRKNLGTMNIKNVEACGLVASGSFNRYINMQGIKRTNWFLNREAELLYFYFQKDGQKRIIIIEPSEEMTNLIKRTLPQGVWQNN